MRGDYGWARSRSTIANNNNKRPVRKSIDMFAYYLWPAHDATLLWCLLLHYVSDKCIECYALRSSFTAHVINVKELTIYVNKCLLRKSEEFCYLNYNSWENLRSIISIQKKIKTLKDYCGRHELRRYLHKLWKMYFLAQSIITCGFYMKGRWFGS